MIHELKIFTEFFAAVACGVKRAELRKNDRNYQVGDTLHLCEFNQVTGMRTGEYINVTVTHIADVGAWLPDYVLLSVELVDKPVQPVPVVSDAEPSLSSMMRALDAFYADDNVPERAMLAAFRILLADVLNQAHREPATGNTAQQFEALATTGKSEHLRNAERIAREAKALSDRLDATSEVHPRVSGWSERQQRIISYALWRLMHSAYEEASKAGQRNCKEDFDRFMQDAKDAEKIREEFTSAGSGKP